MSWHDNREFFVLARERWTADLSKAVERDAGASQRMAHRFEGWLAAKVAAGATPRDLFAPAPRDPPERPRVLLDGEEWFYGGPDNDACTRHRLYRLDERGRVADETFTFNGDFEWVGV